MRKIKPILFSMLFIWILLLSAVVDAETQGDWTYTVKNKKVTVTAYTGNDADVTIPGEIAGYPVTAISSSAFKNCSSLASVIIPDSVSSIGYQAFRDCSSLSTVNIPDSVSSIGFSAFWGCSSLSSITIPDSVSSIENYTFYGCSSLSSVTIPDSVTSIGDSAFSICSSLTSVTIPDSVTSIGESAFYNCSNLSSITIPDSVSSIGFEAFSYCSSLASVRIPDSVSSIGSYAFSYCPATRYCAINTSGSKALSKAGYSFVDSKYPDLYLYYSYSGDDIIGFEIVDADESITEVVFPDEVTSIGGRAFDNCSDLSTVSIPDSVTFIGDYAFNNCSGLTSVTIPDSVITIGSYAFQRCSTLKYIYLPSTIQSFPSFLFSSSLPPIVYCHEYSEADYWATSKNYTVIYVDGENMDAQRTVELSPKSLIMAKGNSFELQTTICPELDMPELIWSSSDPEIISVNAGTLTAHDKGTAVISLTVGSKTATMSAESYLPVESFTLPEEEWVLAKSSLSLAPQEYYPEDALPVFSWTSSDDSVATVDQNGLVTGRKPGDVQITATSETGISESCTVHICYPVTEITFDAETLSVHMQDEVLLITHVTMRDQHCDNRMVQYTSSDETVATISETGMVIPHKIGTVTLTATAESGVTASITCSVLPCREHVPVLTPGVLPADGHPGLSIGSVCSVCGLTLETPQEIESVTTLTLPAALKAIHARAFEKTAADHVLLPAGTTAIGSRAFADAPNLRFVTVPDSVNYIAPDAFEGCSLVTFLCSDSSAAAAYAEEHGFAHTAP